MLRINLLRNSHAPPAAFRDYFRACGVVALETIVTETYGIGSRKLKEKADAARSKYPKTARVVFYATNWAYWIGNALFCSWLGRQLESNVLGYTIGAAHIAAVNIGSKIVRGESLPRSLKPDLGIYAATFSVLEAALAYPSLLGMAYVAGDNSTPISTGTAIASVATMMGITVLSEMIAFPAIWNHLVLERMTRGNILDYIKGFWREFNPLAIFRGRKIHSVPATARETCGRVWGIIESNWGWTQIARLGYAMLAVKLTEPACSEFIDAYYRISALYGSTIIAALVYSRNREQTKQILESIDMESCKKG